MPTQRAPVKAQIDDEMLTLQIRFTETPHGFDPVEVCVIRGFGTTKEIATHRVWNAVTADLYAGGPIYDALLRETQLEAV